jgi:hypothetical protein
MADELVNPEGAQAHLKWKISKSNDGGGTR